MGNYKTCRNHSTDICPHVDMYIYFKIGIIKNQVYQQNRMLAKFYTLLLTVPKMPHIMSNNFSSKCRTSCPKETII